MISRIIEWCAHNRFLVFTGVLLLTLTGIWSMGHIPLDALPDISDVQVIIHTSWEGEPPNIIEDQVTYPIVTALLAAPRVKAVRAQTMFNDSYVFVVFEDGTDIYWARSRVVEYLQTIAGRLPANVHPAIGPDATGAGWVYEYVLVDHSHKQSLADLRSIQDWHLRYQLATVPGVAEVASIGGFVRQYQVQLDPNKLLAYGIPLSTVLDRVKSSTNEVGGRVLELSGTRYMIRGLGYLKSLDDLANVPVMAKNGTPVLIKDLGTVSFGPDLREGVAEWNGEGETVGGIVVMRYGLNALNVINGVKKKLAEIKGSLPPGVEVVSGYDRGGLINESINTLKHSLLEEAIIVSLVIIVFLLHFRSALIPILTLPIALVISFIPMYYLNVSSNIMSLGGLALAIGVLVDAAIVISYSVGMKGARVTTGPRGTYVTLGRNGVYYRQRITQPYTDPAIPRPQPEQQADPLLHTITSDPIEELTDSDSRAFVDEMNMKAKRISYFRLFCLFPAIISLTAFIIYFAQDSYTRKKTSYFVSIDSAGNVNIRQGPDKNSPAIGTASVNQQYVLLDTADKAWNKIKFGDSIGYVSRRFSRVDSSKAIVNTFSRFETDSKDAISVSVIGSAFFMFMGVVFYKQDKSRLLVEINYEFDEHIHAVYNKFLQYFNELLHSRNVWQHLHARRTYDYKHNAGAGALINRIRVQRISPDFKPARFFRTNIAVPNIKLRNTELYFFPERLIIKRGSQFAAIFYRHLQLTSQPFIFIEESAVPSDARIVGHTWKFLNKDGSPDRRFNNNRQLPECRYSKYHFSSDTGINEVITTSREGAFDNFVHIVMAIGKLQEAYSNMD